MKRNKSKAIFLLLAGVLLSAATTAQHISVQGRVIDQGGLPLAGATIKIDETAQGTITNAGGEYKINVPNENTKLTFSFFGSKSQTVLVGKKRVINITLEEDEIQLNELVVVGYGTMKRSDLTGSVVSVQASELEKIPVSNPAEALAGKMAGVQITTSEGEPDAEIKIRIRGGGSITQDNSPLYIIDGFPSDLGLSAVDPNEIQSIDVLKDASATSIYGARGANGVVIITTKGGREGKFNVSYNGYAGVRLLTKTLDMAGSQQYVMEQFEKGARAGMLSPTWDAGTKGYYGEYSEIQSRYGNSEYIDWQREMFGRTAVTQMHNVSIAGGSKTTKFSFGYTNNNEDGILKDSKFIRNTFRFKFDTRADKVSFGASGSYQNRAVYGTGTSEAESSSVYSKLINIMQYRPVAFYNQSIDDLIDSEMEEGDNNGSYMNPKTLLQATEKVRKQNTMQFNASFEYRITKELTLKLSGGYSKTGDETSNRDTEKSRYARMNNGYTNGSIVLIDRDKWNNSNTLTYNKTFKKAHNLNVLLGHEMNQSNYQSRTMTLKDMESSELGLNNLKQAKTKELENDMYSESILSFFGRANYNYKSRYYLSASLRADGSSKFAPNQRFGYFPSVSAAWRINEEKFFKGVAPSVDNLKLRASYGTSGNNRIRNFMYSTSFSTVYYNQDNKAVLGIAPSALANPNLKWETTASANVGVDFGFFGNRLTGSLEYYNNVTSDLLLSANIPNLSGYGTQLQNVGKTSNQGVEFVLNGVILEKRDLSWNIGFNISHNQNKVLALNQGQDYMLFSSGWGNISGDYIVKVGQPIGQIYGYKSDGMYTINDFTDEAIRTGIFSSVNLKEGVAYNSSQAKNTNLLGLPKLKRINSSERSATTSPDLDRTVIGNTNPVIYGGINSNFRYKNFDASISFSYSVGNDVYNATKLRANTQTFAHNNAIKLDGQRYTVIDPVLQKPITQLGGTTDEIRNRFNELNQNATEYAVQANCEYLVDDYIEDGSYLRLQNLTVGYTMPFSWLKKIGVQKLRIYATGYNLLLFTRYSGYDPDVDTRRNVPTTPGVDYAAYPRNRQFIGGLNITF